MVAPVVTSGILGMELGRVTTQLSLPFPRIPFPGPVPLMNTVPAVRKKRITQGKQPKNPRLSDGRLVMGGGYGLDPRVKAKIWSDYLTGEFTVMELSEKYKHSFFTLQAIIKKEGWSIRRRALGKELTELVNLQSIRTVKEHFLKVVQRHLNISGELDDQILQALGISGTKTPRDLESLAKALKNSADVAARAVGLDTKTTQLMVTQNQPRTINYNIQAYEPGEAPLSPDALEASFVEAEHRSLPADLPVDAAPSASTMPNSLVAGSEGSGTGLDMAENKKGLEEHINSSSEPSAQLACPVVVDLAQHLMSL